MQHYNDTLSYSTLVLDLPHASSSVAIVLSFPTDCALSGVVLSRPGPEALRPYIGQARPTYRAYEGLGPGLRLTCVGHGYISKSVIP